MSFSAAHIVAQCLVAVSGAVIHAPPNALPPSALLFLVTSLVISSPPICAFLPPHPYCLTPLSILFYTPITHSPSVPFLPFQCCFVPFRPSSRFLSSFFPVPFAPSRSFPVPLAARFSLLVSTVSKVLDILLDNTQCRPFILTVSLCRAPMSVSPVVVITLVVPSDCCPLNNINA